jgi:hypothetical protein
MGRHSLETRTALEQDAQKRAAARRARVTEDREFVAMLGRMIRRMEQRLINDPSCLPEVIELGQALMDAPNVAIAMNAARYSSDPFSAPSANELARLLDVARQTVQDRRKKGDKIIFERQMGVGVLRVSQRQAATLAAKRADEALSAWLERKDAVQ